jgi:hypothetical protein
MSVLRDEPRGSNLTFVASEGRTEFISFDRLQRVREPVSRSKSGVQGKVADVVHGRSRHAESGNEIKAFQVLLATGRADNWQEQPFHLEYRHDEAKHRYTPDILVAWGKHQEVVEVKDDTQAELPESRARFALIGELLAEHGYHFRLWKRSEIQSEPRFSNAALVLRYRCVAVPPAQHERLRRILSSTPDLDVRSLCDCSKVAVQIVLRLVLDGTLHIDWWKPLTLDARVSAIPIGRQVWPCPPPPDSIPAVEEARCR